MAKHTQRNIVFIVFGVIIVGSMIFLFQGGVSGEIDITLAPPLQLTDAGFIPISLPVGETVVEATGINCKVKQTTLVFGINNKQLVSLDSAGIQGSPFIRLAFLQGGTGEVEVVAYNVNPKIFCSDANNIPIEVAIRDLQLTVRAEYLGLRNVLETQGVVGSRLLSFGQGQGEQTLISFPVQVSQLENQLPNQDFPITLFFEITGKVNVYYRDFPSLVYSIPIFRNDLQVTHTIDIRKAPTTIQPLDSDGDGYPDSTDSCPNLAENFNGFEDLDGCPDTAPTLITCSDGSIVSSTTLCPPPPVITCELQDDRNCTRSLCEADGGVFIEERNIFNQVTGSYCELDTSVKPICEPDEKLELQTGNIFICVPDPDLQDTDGDGILNGIDACPNLFGVAEFNGCPTTPPIINGEFTLQEKVIKGDIVTLTTVRFSDNSVETATASARGGGIQLPNLSQQITNLIPAQLFGTITGGEGKAIDEITIEVFYFNNESQEFIIESKEISLILTIDESTVSSATSNPIPLLGSIGRGELSPQSGEVSPFGTGISLGRVTISAENIIDLGEEADIKSGQRKDANLIFSISGFVNFRDVDERERFLLTNTLITFKNVDIDNQAIPVAPINCTDLQIDILDPQTGKVIGCETPPPTAPKCFSSERPQGYACSAQDILTFCDGDPTSCREKDVDNDGVPNHRDRCRDVTKSDLIEDRLTINGSDPDDGCSAIQKKLECNPLIQNCTPEPPEPPELPPFCSETNPDACIIPPEQFLLIVIAGVVIAIVVGVALIIRSRQPKVFGA